MCGIHLNHELFEREIPRRLAGSGRQQVSFVQGGKTVTFTAYFYSKAVI
jgi:hypothetical protein